ncbi:hypothetical protein HPB50_022143 [Hyalomma asiaticum]|uniref:Uncharacterized protein n=1 Tax=Hyalomma asiaticum TaxID=266040 RepID=A0ACB7TBI7_HYAAI|nr:hypothetical protein HPB50_022143 [Hyalomma asiaticum]
MALSILDVTRNVVGGQCTCKAGVGSDCKPAAALAFAVDTERTESCTSSSQSWGAPEKKCTPKGKGSASEKTGPLDVHYEWEKEQIMFESSTDPSSKLQVTSVVACKTQRTTAWHKARACRITSTLAHRILRHRGPSEDLAEKIIRQKRITTAAMIYGIKLEPAGRAWFAYHENVIVHEFGFVLKDSQPWLGCSPDGVIECPHSETELLEIKCSYSKRSGKEMFLEGKSYVHYGVRWSMPS